MSGTGKMSPRDEMEALLPFYLNGTLEGAELAAVEAWLASDPAAMAALDEAEAEFSGASAANEAIRPPADALSRFAKMLDTQAGPVHGPKPSSVVSLWSRFRAMPATVGWAIAAVLLALVIVQQVTRPGGHGGDFEIAGAETDLSKLPFALVKFKPDAKMADIAAFLSGNGLKIAAGPNADGIFRIAMAVGTTADYDRLFGLIGAQPFTETALEGRKPSNG